MYDYLRDLAAPLHRGTTTDLAKSQNGSRGSTWHINLKLWGVASTHAASILKKINYPVNMAFSTISSAVSSLCSRYCKQVEPTLHCSEKVMQVEGKKTDKNNNTGFITAKVKMHKAIQQTIEEKKSQSEEKAAAEFETVKNQLQSNCIRDCDAIEIKNPEHPGPALGARIDNYHKELKELTDIHAAIMKSFSSLYQERMERERIRYKDQFNLTFALYNSEVSNITDEFKRGVISNSQYDKLQHDVEGKYYDKTVTYDPHDYAVAMKEIFQGTDEQVEEEYQVRSFDPAIAHHSEDEMVKEEDQPFQSEPNVMPADDIDEYDGDLDHTLHDERAAKHLDMEKLKQENRALLSHLEESEKEFVRKIDSLEDEMDQLMARLHKSSYTDHEYERYLKMEEERMAEFDRDIEETDERLENMIGVKSKK